MRNAGHLLNIPNLRAQGPVRDAEHVGHALHPESARPERIREVEQAKKASSRSWPGLRRLQAIASDFLDVISDNPSLQAFLAGEGEAGLRLLTAPAGNVRPRIVLSVAAVIQHEADVGAYRPPAAPALIADGIVSLGERFLYHHGDRTMNPDPENAKRIIGLLLREDPSSAR